MSVSYPSQAWANCCCTALVSLGVRYLGFGWWTSCLHRLPSFCPINDTGTKAQTFNWAGGGSDYHSANKKSFLKKCIENPPCWRRYDTDISPFSFWCVYAQKLKFIDDLTLNCQVSGLLLLLKCPTIFAGVTLQRCAWKITEIETQTLRSSFSQAPVVWWWFIAAKYYNISSFSL